MKCLWELCQCEVFVVVEQVEAISPDRDRVDGRAGVDGVEGGRDRGDAEGQVLVKVEEVGVREGIVRQLQQFGE